ncbi:hypothetical protein TNCV_3326451 [Trichonephila clavipes]|nr:hypothetical protein TNCV_3326451 [Trichonephila clavipes]
MFLNPQTEKNRSGRPYLFTNPRVTSEIVSYKTPYTFLISGFRLILKPYEHGILNTPYLKQIDDLSKLPRVIHSVENLKEHYLAQDLGCFPPYYAGDWIRDGGDKTMFISGYYCA